MTAEPNGIELLKTLVKLLAQQEQVEIKFEVERNEK